MFLLIAFVLNVASLNIEKDPSSLVDLFADVAPMHMNISVESSKKDLSSLVELFADVAPMRMNESVESLKKDPSSFVELFAGADPGVINQVIGLLETLVSEAVSSLDNLENRKTETSNNFNTASTELLTAQDALEEANTAKSNAENAETAAKLKHQTAEVEKDLAINNYDEQSPNLNKEKRVLHEVIEQLRSISVTWYLADEGQSCTSKCAELSSECVDSAMWPQSAEWIETVARLVGYTCAYTEERCDYGETPIYSPLRQNCQFCGRSCCGYDDVDERGIPKYMCQKRYSGRQRMCACRHVNDNACTMMTHYGPNCWNFVDCNGPLSPLTNHACSSNGMISDCCGYDSDKGGCMVLLNGEFVYPCYDHGDVSK